MRNKATRESRPYEYNGRVRRADGQYRWILVRGVPVHGNDGNLTEWVGVVVDVHDEHEARLQLLDRTAELAERVRELRCLHTIAVACSDDRLSVPEVLRTAMQSLASGLTRPDQALCEIAWADMVLRSRETVPVTGRHA